MAVAESSVALTLAFAGDGGTNRAEEIGDAPVAAESFGFVPSWAMERKECDDILEPGREPGRKESEPVGVFAPCRPLMAG